LERGQFSNGVDSQEHILGSDRSDTLTARSTSPPAIEAGRMAEAIAVQNLVDSERVLGSDHPGALNTRNCLADAFRDAGRTAEAVNLAGTEPSPSVSVLSVLGSDHPDA
jgi:hypothetical protein